MSLAAIVASVALMVSMAIMVASFRDSLDAWLERILPADLYVRAASAGDTAFLAPDVQRAIAALPGVRRAEFLREQQLAARSGAAARRAARAHDRPGRSGAQPAAHRRAARRRGGRAAARVGQRGGGRSLRLRAGCGRRAAARRARRCASPSRASGATTRASRARS